MDWHPLCILCTILYNQNDQSNVTWKEFVQSYRHIANDEPGSRFMNTYRRWKRVHQSPVIGAVVVGIGVLLIVIGMLLGLVPGVPGILLGVVGMALLAARFRRIAVALDWTETQWRKLWHRLRRRHRRR